MILAAFSLEHLMRCFNYANKKMMPLLAHSLEISLRVRPSLIPSGECVSSYHASIVENVLSRRIHPSGLSRYSNFKSFFRGILFLAMSFKKPPELFSSSTLSESSKIFPAKDSKWQGLHSNLSYVNPLIFQIVFQLLQ